MSGFLPLLALIAVGLACGFTRAGLKTWTVASAAALTLASLYSGASWVTLGLTWVVFAAIAVVLNYRPLRVQLLSQPMLDVYQRIAPQLSDTERVALEAGTVGWEGELFSGRPRWSKLLKAPAPQLSGEEKAFMDGPVEEVCALINDWEITHERNDLSPQVWDFLKRNRFFGMIIPKEYGGLGFSAHAHSVVLQKLSSISPTVSSTVAVPNSLGPAELLLHYGTDEQKKHYLPRLADGREIPCFGLTNPWAGSDATSIPDYGVVCKRTVDGQEVLGISLTFEKRYITLAPVASVIGLAFRLLDPDGLLGDKKDVGISLALVPRNTPGLEVGRRHLPLNIPFQNGPVSGKDMFVPLDQLIGGTKYAGQGWRMLVECLSVGRAISLPSGSTGSVRMAALATGAYARIRKQFGMSIGRFEGIEEALARIGGLTYAVSAVSRMTAAAVDQGEKPAVTSAIAKYHATELGRSIIQDAMDVHGGKTIILGPKNYLGRQWQGSPISITVEGANILTRNMIIFGQGAVRCHPYVLKLMQAASVADPQRRISEFDNVLFKHVGFAVSNACRAFLYGLTHSRIGTAPGDSYTKRYYRKLSRYSAALALVADTSMLLLGGKLKQKERISARLGDVLSYLYIASSMLKRFEDQGRPELDRPFLAWAFHECIHRIQAALDGVLRNFPVRPAAWLLRALVFPIGRLEALPGDRLGRRVATLLMYPNEARDRLGEFCYLTPTANNPAGQMNSVLASIIEAEPIERKLAKAAKAGTLTAPDAEAQLAEAVQYNVITEVERDLLIRTRAATADIIAVDDFDTADLVAGRRTEAGARANLRSAA
ncbi:MAG: acyl-CoA dehydrogenase [Rhodanobacteraceae bacterium]|nr:acyl-CoA dehydrogenase [Xanthomonadales bacterium]MCP5475715.1 acyl-CoA dehydrogenase [Rhodanobacteraceae bacterium]